MTTHSFKEPVNSFQAWAVLVFWQVKTQTVLILFTYIHQYFIYCNSNHEMKKLSYWYIINGLREEQQKLYIYSQGCSNIIFTKSLVYFQCLAVLFNCVLIEKSNGYCQKFSLYLIIFYSSVGVPVDWDEVHARYD